MAFEVIGYFLFFRGPGMGSTVLCLVAAAALLCAPVFAQKVAMRLYPGCAARCRVRESTALTRAYVRPQERTLVDELAALSWEVWPPRCRSTCRRTARGPCVHLRRARRH